jgi:hypothetical protein
LCNGYSFDLDDYITATNMLNHQKNCSIKDKSLTPQAIKEEEKKQGNLFYPRPCNPPTYYCWEGQTAPLATMHYGVARATVNELCLSGMVIVQGMLAGVSLLEKLRDTFVCA